MKRSLEDPGVHRGTMGIATVGGKADNCTKNLVLQLQERVIGCGICNYTADKSPYMQKWCGVYQMHINQTFT